MKVAYSYVRFSSPEQRKGNSLRRQTERSEAWGKVNGYSLDHSLKLHDLGVSAFRGHNAKFGKLAGFIQAVESGKVKQGSALVVESLDRLSRDEVGEALELFLRLLRLGITIVTLEPEQLFDRSSINNPANLVVAIMFLSRAHNESATKSYRVGDAWRRKKENARTGHKVTARCPGWLALRPDRECFEVIREKGRTVKEIFEWYLSGLGITLIVRRLNSEQRATFTESARHWHSSTVRKILTNRAVIGEYQPYSGHSWSDRRPDGQPIPDYYPSIIEPNAFYRVQQLLDQKRTNRERGAIGKGYANLFTGLLWDAQNKSPMQRIDKGKKSQPFLISAAAKSGRKDAISLTFPYRAFEEGFLTGLMEIKPEDVISDHEAYNLHEQLSGIEGEVTHVEVRISEVKQRIETDPEIDSLIDILRTLEQKRRELKARRERLHAEIDSRKTNALAHTQHIQSVLRKTEGEAYLELRAKLRQLLRGLIERIWLAIISHSPTHKTACIQINFSNGEVRRMILIYRIRHKGGGGTNPVPFTTLEVISGRTGRQDGMLYDLASWDGRPFHEFVELSEEDIAKTATIRAIPFPGL